jgi:hypothetical protein
MRQMFTLLIIFVLVFSSVDAFSQLSRKNQFEIYAGAGFPLSPDDFKDYYKVGLSLNVQYVIFPSYRLGIPIFVGYEGFTVDKDAINNDFKKDFVGGVIYDDFGNYLGEITDANFDVSGNAGIIKFGAGIRPYLSSPESSTQFFLFGNITFNVYREKNTLDGGTVTVTDVFGDEYEFDIIQDLGFQETDVELKVNKVGLGLGAGIEIPAGTSINLIFQGMYNIIFTKGDYEIDINGIDVPYEVLKNHSFIGVTGGIIF